MVILFLSNFSMVYAFDYPVLNSSYYVQDNANILSTNLKTVITSKGNEYFKKKIECSIVTISKPVGDKVVYTKQLKEWWNIGSEKNGIIIVFYPNSKDSVEILIDSSLENYISPADLKEYKDYLQKGLIENNLDNSITYVFTDLDKKLIDYGEKDILLEKKNDFIDSLKFNLNPKTILYKIFNIDWLEHSNFE